VKSQQKKKILNPSQLPIVQEWGNPHKGRKKKKRKTALGKRKEREKYGEYQG